MKKYENVEIEIVEMTSDIITFSMAFDGEDDEIKAEDL